jgi:hypothetical protein
MKRDKIKNDFQQNDITFYKESDVGRKNEFIVDDFIKNKLQNEMEPIKMSSALKKNIIQNTVNRREKLSEKICNLMNKTIEIPVSYTVAACFILFLAVISPSMIITNNMKHDQSIQGYSDVEILRMNGSDVLIPKNLCEVSINEKN